MTVRELKILLNNYSDDTEVVIEVPYTVSHIGSVEEVKGYNDNYYKCGYSTNVKRGNAIIIK